MMPALKKLALAASLGGLLLAGAASAAQPPLRLCADPTNLPFSSDNAKTPGLYLAFGQAIGHALGRPAEPVWHLTYFGKRALRETLLAGACDMAVGLPADPEFMGPRLVLTKPFMHVGYALVFPRDRKVNSLADLRGKRVAVQFNSTPQSLLADHPEVESVTFLDPDAAMDALAAGQVDAAFIWGPSAGYRNHAALQDRFQVMPVAGPGMQFPVAIGFAKADAGLRDQVDALLDGLSPALAQLKARYGVPEAVPVTLVETVPVSPVRFASTEWMPEGSVASAFASGIVRVTDATTAPQAAASQDPAKVAAGRLIFNSICAHCHGPDAEQAVRKINLRLLHHRYGDQMDDVFHTTVTHGRPDKGMPNWSGVYTETEFAQILAFLHTVQTD
jgi:ABC-type amino acid transport substrate-binding protein/mono/diheme cytochrome c family protein